MVLAEDNVSSMSSAVVSSPQQKPIVAIYGCGLIGSFLAGSLSHAEKATVHMIARSKTKYSIEARQGITLSCPKSSSPTRFAPLSSFTIHESLAAFKSFCVENNVKPDFIALTMKRTGNKQAVEEMKAVGLSELGWKQSEKEQLESLTSSIEDPDVSLRSVDSDWVWSKTTIITVQNGARSATLLRESLGHSLDVIDGMVLKQIVTYL